MGRLPKSNRLKILSGSRHARKQNATTPEDLPMWDPPPFLGQHGLELWNDVGGTLLRNGIIQSLDRALFEALCSTWDLIQRIRAVIREEGPVIDDARKSLKKHPLMGALNTNMTMFKNLCSDFGLSPVSRDRLGLVIEDLDTDDAWEKFAAKRKERQEAREMEALIDPPINRR